MCYSASSLFRTSSGTVRYLHYLSQALCLELQQAFPHFPPEAELGEVCKPKVSPPRAEPGWRSPTPQKCYYLGKEQASPLPFLPLESQSWPCCQPGRGQGEEEPSPAGSAQQVSLHGSSTQGKPRPRGWKLAEGNNTTFICTEPLESCKGLFRGRELGLQTRGGPRHKDKPRSQRWAAWRLLPTPREIPTRFPGSALRPRCLN